MNSLKEKVVIITGSTRGLGHAMAMLFSRKGAHVAIVGRKNDECVKVLEEIRENGGDGLAICADVAAPDGRESIFTETIKKYGRIDIFVNNAGAGKKTPLLATDIKTVHELFAINFDAPFLCLQRAAKEMIARSIPGRIINISSTAGLTGESDFCIYASAKAGIIQLTKSAAIELGQYGITVNSVAPGTTYNPDDKNLLPEVIRAMSVVNPLGRLGDAEDIAHMVAFLASDSAKSITGQTFAVDCGYNTSHYNLMGVEENLRKHEQYK